MASLLHANECHATLAIDIMDRNLYERANDCRWWALTSVFSELLSKAQHSDQDMQALGAILRAINNLYTVYANLIVFDRAGRIVAAANAGGCDPAGATLAGEWVTRILSLADFQDYAVSPFEPTRLYGGGPTYIYGAAIRAPQRGPVVGGIAIVFDSGPQFAAMLNDALPRDGAGAVKPGAFGLFVEPNRLLRRPFRFPTTSSPSTRHSSAWRQGSVTPVSPSSTGPIMRSAPRHHRATGSTRARATLTATT
ncbi:MAG TPA: hypothetical protein VGI22_16485 [Xanthobacteraceae bacterium]